MGGKENAAGAGLIFTHFMKGYMEGSAQANAARMEKAKGLMDIAAKQAEIIDTSTNPESRAYAHKILTDVMKEAEKAMKPDPGFFGMIRGAFGKKGKNSDMQDPKDLYKDLLSPYGMESQPASVGGQPGEGGNQPAPTEGNQPASTQGNQPSGLASNFVEPGPGTPVSKYAMYSNQPEGQPSQTNELSAQKPPESPMQPRPTMDVLMPRKTQVGSSAIAPEEVTGRGPEKVQVAPDQFDYRIDGVQVSPREYRGYIVRMAESNANLNARGKQLEQDRALALKDRSDQAAQEILINKQKADNLRKSQWYQGEITSGDPARVKLANDAVAVVENPELKIENPSYFIEQVVGSPDPKTGARKRSFQVIDKRTGMPTGRTAIPDVEEPPDADEFATLGLLKEGQAKDPNFTYHDAVLARGKQVLEDARVAQRVKQLTLGNAAMESQLKQIELKAKQRQSDPNRAWINGIYDDITKVLLASVKADDSIVSAQEAASTVFNGTIQMLSQYGISFEEFLKVNGRDPAQLKETIKKAYLDSKGATGGSTGGGKPVTRGF